MKNKLYLALIAVIALGLSSCTKEAAPEFHLTTLQGLWLEEKANTEHYVRFTNEPADEEGYFFGREWHAEGDVDEKDLYVYEKDSQGNDSLIHGNGWFQYQLEIKGDLHEIHFMDNGDAEIPKEYIVTMLNDNRLEYHTLDYVDDKFFFNRVQEQ